MLNYSMLLEYPGTSSEMFETKLSDSSYSYNKDLFRSLFSDFWYLDLYVSTFSNLFLPSFFVLM